MVARAQHRNVQQAERLYKNGIHVTAATTILRPAADLYAVWRRLEELPRFIDHLERVERLDDVRSRWTTKGPMGKSYSWEAEIIRDEPNETIVWRTLDDAPVVHAGAIRFQQLPFERGTAVRVTMEYLPPAGGLGDALARLTGDDARTQLKEGLHRFRQLMETGEVATTAGQPRGTTRWGAEPKEDETTMRKTDAELRRIATTKGEEVQS